MNKYFEARNIIVSKKISLKTHNLAFYIYYWKVFIK